MNTNTSLSFHSLRIFSLLILIIFLFSFENKEPENPQKNENQEIKTSTNHKSPTIKYFQIDKILSVVYFPDGKLKSLVIGKYSPIFSQSFYRNGNTRKIGFQNAENHIFNMLYFTDDGRLLLTESSLNNYPDSLLPNPNTATQYTKAVGMKYIPNSFYTDTLRNGKYTLFYANGNPLAEMNFDNNIPEGKFIFYDALNADTLYYSSYSKGKPLGYYVNKFAGKITTDRGEIMTNGKNLWYERYKTDGTPKSKKIVDSKGQTILTEEYWENGAIKSKNNALTHHRSSYDHEGNLSSETIEHDSLGINKSYFSKTGDLRAVSYYLNHKQDSIAESYYEPGILQYRLHYKKGKRQGSYIYNFKDGKPRFIGQFKDDKSIGKWLVYDEDKVDTLVYKNGKVVVKTPKYACGCLDTTLNSIGYAPRVVNLLKYRKFANMFPDYIKPIDSLIYTSLFYTGFYSDQHGSYSLKLIMTDELSINFPEDEQLKIIFNPCRTQGYFSNMEVNLSDNSNNSTLFAPKRIAITLLKSPLKSADADHKIFVGFFDTKYVQFSNYHKLTIDLAKKPNACFSLGTIRDFLTLEVKSAKPLIFKKLSYIPLEITKDESKDFFGFQMDTAVLSFDFKQNNETYNISATSNYILAGGHFVSGIIKIPCKKIGKGRYQLTANNNLEFRSEYLINYWRKKGFSRLKTNYDKKEKVLLLYFFSE